MNPNSILNINGQEKILNPRYFAHICRRELKLDRVDAVIRSIRNSYNIFEFYQENRDEVERHTLEVSCFIDV